MRKKVWALSLIVVMVISMLPAKLPTLADKTVQDFVDMPNNWSTAALKKAVSNGLLYGHAVDGKYFIHGNEPMTRAELAAVMNRAFGAVKEAELNEVTDVPANAWYANDLMKAVMMGILMKDTLMRPESNISRQEAFVILARAFKLNSNSLDFNALENYSDQAEIAEWAQNELAALVEVGYIQGFNDKLYPNATISRAEFATVMANLVQHYIDTPGEITDVPLSGNVIVRVPGVTLKDVAIDGDLIIADGVGEEDVTLDNVAVLGRTLVRGGDENAVTIKGGSNLDKVIVLKADGKVRISVEDGAHVEVVYIGDGSDDILVEGTIGTLEVVGDDLTAFATNAFITNAFVSGNRSTIIMRDESTLLEGMISGTDSKISVENKATVENIIVTGRFAKIEGNGTVKQAEVKDTGDNASITTPNTKIVSEKGADGITAAGGAPVESSSSVTNNDTGTWIVLPTTPPTIPTAPSGGGGVYIPPTVSAVTITTSIDVSSSLDNAAVVQTTLSTATMGADIYYTVDGSTPTANSTKYTAPFNVQANDTVGKTITIKAMAMNSGYTNSEVAQKQIVFNPAVISLTNISILSDPTTLSYNENDTLDLTGLQVQLIYSDASTETVAFANFSSKGITTNPINGATLTIANHNGKPIEVSYNGKSANTNNLVVSLNPVTITAITGVTAPVTDATPDTTITETPQYTGVISWSPAIVENKFVAGTSYTATITLTPKADYTLSGIAADSFTVTGATATNAANSGVITAVFPATSEFAGGAGTLADPYQVATAEQLNSVRNHFDKYFIQTADIDLTSFVGVGGAGYNDGKGWLPIRSNSSDFTGHYNGNNKTISNLKIHRPDEYEVGLFHSNYGSIENVSLSNVDVIGNSYVGGLVGSNQVSESFIGKITNSHVTTGSVKGSGVDIGGLVGFNTPETEIKNSSSGASVSPNGSSIPENIGGLVGRNGGTISASHATGNVEGKSQIGGLVGLHYDSAGSITNSYATGVVTGTSSIGGLVGWAPSGTIIKSYATGGATGTGSYIGGLVGLSAATISTSYATGASSGNNYIGGLVGRNFGSISTSYATGTGTGTGFNIGGLVGGGDSSAVTDSYWDTETSLQTTSFGGIGKTTNEMKLQSTYTGWDFTATWNIDSTINNGYPHLGL